MKVKITDLMDLYENPATTHVSGSGEEPKIAGKETTNVKAVKHKFSWRQTVIAAVLALSIGLGGFALARSFRGKEPSHSGTQNPTDQTGSPSESVTPRPTGGEWELPRADTLEINRILSVFAQRGILDSAALSDEYEKVCFVHTYLKLYHPEELGRSETENGVYETLSLDRANEYLRRLIGQQVSPVEGTDYTQQRFGRSPNLHESFHDGLFWWPAEENESYNQFSKISGWAPGKDGFTVAFNTYEIDLERWPDFLACDLPALTDDRILDLQRLGTISQAGLGTAFVRDTGDGHYVESYRETSVEQADPMEQINSCFQDWSPDEGAKWRSFQLDADGSSVIRDLILKLDLTFTYREGDAFSAFSFWASGEYSFLAGDNIRFTMTETDEDGNPLGECYNVEYHMDFTDNGAMRLIQISQSGFNRNNLQIEIAFWHNLQEMLEEVVEANANRYWVGEELTARSLKEASTLVIAYFRPEDARILPWLSKLETLQLNLDGAVFSDGNGMEFLEELPRLETLSLDLDTPVREPISLEVLNRCAHLRTLSVSGGPADFDLSDVSGLHLDELRIGRPTEELAKLGTVDCLYLMGEVCNLDRLAPMNIRHLNLNNGSVDPPKIDFTGVEQLTTVDRLDVDDCAVLDFTPILGMKNLKTIQFAVSCTEHNSSAFYAHGGSSSQMIYVTSENAELLDDFEWNVPAAQLKAFLEREGSSILLYLRWQ